MSNQKKREKSDKTDAFRELLERVDRRSESAEFQKQAREFIRISSTIPEDELDRPMSTISSCPIMLSSVIPKEDD